MGALQTLINYAETIEFDRRNVVGIQYTRSEIPKVSETPTRNAWKINFKVSAGMPYNDFRELLEQVDDLDRRKPDYITFSNNSKLAWIARYRAPDFGVMTPTLAQTMLVDRIKVVNNVAYNDTIILKNLPTITGGMTSVTPLLKAGDFIQLGSGTTNPYPFTVLNDVLRGSGTEVEVQLHRPVFFSGYVNQAITVGSNVTFRMFCSNMPVYKLIPGATKYVSGVMVNNAYIEWSDDFKLYEWTGEA